MTGGRVAGSLVLVTSNPRLLAVFLDKREERLGPEVEIPRVLWVRPSMKFRDRLNHLKRTLIVRGRINGIPAWQQLFHHFAYRWISRSARLSKRSDDSGWERALRHRHELCVVTSANSPEAVEVLSRPGPDLALVLGADVLARRTLDRTAMPMYNVHLSDPRFVRGKPPVFWEVFEGRDDVVLTLHRLTPRLDAGPIVRQRSVPVEWHRTLVDTMRATRRSLPEQVAGLLFESLPGLLDGSAPLQDFSPGPLRTSPKISQIIHAHRVCARRGRTGGAAR